MSFLGRPLTQFVDDIQLQFKPPVEHAGGPPGAELEHVLRAFISSKMYCLKISSRHRQLLCSGVVLLAKPVAMAAEWCVTDFHLGLFLKSEFLAYMIMHDQCPPVVMDKLMRTYREAVVSALLRDACKACAGKCLDMRDVDPASGTEQLISAIRTKTTEVILGPGAAGKTVVWPMKAPWMRFVCVVGGTS